MQIRDLQVNVHYGHELRTWISLYFWKTDPDS